MPDEQEDQIIATIDALIKSDEDLRRYGLKVTCPTIVGSPHQSGFHAVQISSKDPIFTFRMTPYNQHPEPFPRRASRPLYHGHYDVDATSGKVLNKYGVPSIVSHIFPVRPYAGKVIRVDVTPEGYYRDRLETATIAVEVSPSIVADPDKAQLVKYILIAGGKYTDLMALYHLRPR